MHLSLSFFINVNGLLSSGLSYCSYSFAQMIKGPVTKHFPLDCKRLGFSWAATRRVPMQEYVKGLPDDKTIVFVVGAFAHGKVDAPWVDEEISVSEYPLSAAYALGRITNAFEQKWGIV